MNCPRCGRRNPAGFAFCAQCGSPLVSAAPWFPPRPALHSQPATLVGRDAEQAELQDVARNLLAGQGGIVSVIGAAGLGKTRLVATLRLWLECHAAPDAAPLWLIAACQPPGERPGLDVGAQWLRALLGPAAQPDRAAACLEQMARAQLPHDAGFVLRYLVNLVSDPHPPPEPDLAASHAAEPGQWHVCRAFFRLLSALAQQRPLILLVDDLHWTDETSALLLGELWPLAQQQPILFLLLYEPETQRRCWDLRRQATNLYADVYREVFLHPLAEVDAGRLVDGCASPIALPASARGAMLQTAAGNPLFLGECLRWARQVRRYDLWPPTLPGLLAARVAQLDPEARRVLQIAAALGPACPRRVLAAALTLDGQAEDALQHLQQLQAQELMEPAAPPDELHTYVFSHHLVRQAAYESCAESERAHLHLLAAQAIEETEQDRLPEHYAALAHHYARTAQFERALRYMFLAGDQALRRYADAEALAYYQAGLRLAASRPDLLPQRLPLLRREAILHARRGAWLEGIRVYEHLLAAQANDPLGQAETYQTIAQVHRSLGDREAESYYVERALAVLPAVEPTGRALALRAALLLNQSSLAWARGDPPTALAAAQQALELAQQTSDSSLIVMACNQIGAAHLLTGDDALACAAFSRALAACESPTASSVARVRTYLNAGKMQAEIVGDLAAAQALAERALTLAQDAGYDTWAAWAHFSLAELAFAQGDWEQAEEQLRRGEELSANRNLAEPTLHRLLARGQLLLARGQPQAAYEHFRRAAEQAEAQGNVVQGLIPARLGQGLALWMLGRLEPAVLLLEQTLHQSQQEGTPQDVATACFHLARCLLAQGNVAAARRVVDSVASTTLPAQRPQVQAQSHWLRGLLAAAEGQPEAAERDLRAAQRAWQRRGQRYEEAQVLLDLARFYGAQGRASEAGQCRDEAIALFRLLGAASHLAQAEALELAE